MEEQLNELAKNMTKLETVLGSIANNLDKLTDNQAEKINTLINRVENFTLFIQGLIENKILGIVNEIDKLTTKLEDFIKSEERDDKSTTAIVEAKDKQIKLLITILVVLGGILAVLVGLDLAGIIKLVGLKG